MRWVKIISIGVLFLCLFVGGIAFDIFVVQKFSHRGDSVMLANNAMNDNLKLEQNIHVSKMLEPTMLKTSLEIVESNVLSNLQEIATNQRDNITKTLDIIVKLAQDNKDICRVSPYFISPYYKFEDQNNSQKRSYKISMKIDCKMDKTKYEDYKKFFNKILEHVDSNEFLDISFGFIDFVPSKTQIADYESQLRQTAIEQAQALSLKYNESLKAKCNISNIRFGHTSLPTTRNNSIQMVLARDSHVSLDKIADSQLLSSNIEMSLSTQFEFICK